MKLFSRFMLRSCATLAGATLGFTPALAAAQMVGGVAPEVQGEFSVQRFLPAPGPRNYLVTRGARIEGEMAWSAALLANYSNSPFVVRSCSTPTNCDDPAADVNDTTVVENLANFDLLGSLTPIRQLQIGLRVPLIYIEGEGLRENMQPNFDNPLKRFGLGDPELEVKGRFFGTVKDPLVLGGAAFVTAPLGNAINKGEYMGDNSPSGGLRAIVDGHIDPIYVGGNLGFVARSKETIANTNVGTEMRYSVAAGIRISPLLRVIADGYGSSRFSGQNGADSFEIDAAAQIYPESTETGWVATVGGGTSLLQGIGAPKFRILLGVAYHHEVVDRDADGIADTIDQCVTLAEDVDGFQDDDGCPDLDNDDDGTPDEIDKCPNEPEDVDGFEDTDGCPELDNDNDGVPDLQDRCPDEAETKNNFQDDDGCPDIADTDRDGVPDDSDQCPNEAEDTDGFKDTDGCPDLDNDEDGIPDDRDECVDEPETINEIDDEDGCPDGEPTDAAPAP